MKELKRHLLRTNEVPPFSNKKHLSFCRRVKKKAIYFDFLDISNPTANYCKLCVKAFSYNELK